MARLSDFPVCVRRIGLWTFCKRLWHEVNEDQLLTWGAALAYSWLFAIFPFLLFLLTLVPFLPEHFIDQAHDRIYTTLHDVFPQPMAQTIWDYVVRVLYDPPNGLWSIGLLLTLWAASGGINMTMTALDRCYEIEKGRSFFKKRLVAILTTVVVATMIIAVLVLIPVGNLLTKYMLDHWPATWRQVPEGLLIVWYVLRYAIAILLMFTVVAIMYYYGISVKQRWRFFSPGSVFTVAVWIGLAFAFKWYVNAFGKESYTRTYGTLGGVVVLLLFFYLDALVLMIGAQINSEIDFEVLGVERGCRDFTVKPQPLFIDQSTPAAAPVA